jgi:glycosyltransferase involved in cell wall biosynthesis
MTAQYRVATPKTSLIIATYEQPEFLRLAILSALEQTRLPDEIVIADDGSRNSTADAVREMKKISPVPLIHTWLPDEGFRVMLARNNAAAASTGEYLIFLDGDCYLHPFFIADHLSFAEPNRWVCGTRVNIKAKRKEYILRTGDRRITFFSWGTSKKFHAVRSRLLAILREKKGGGMASANFAVWRSDFEKVNGFNERFAGYCGEDYELACRLEDIGVPMKKMVHLGIAYHFDHPRRDNIRWEDGTGRVGMLMQQVRSEEKGRAKNWFEQGVGRRIYNYRCRKSIDLRGINGFVQTSVYP